jgi:hypothetical protein
MNTTNIARNRAQDRESRAKSPAHRSTFPRLTAPELDLARRLSALLGAPTSRAGEPWPLVRVLVALMSPDVVRDVRASETVTRDGHLALLTIDIAREAADCELTIRVACEVHATEPSEDTQEATAVEMLAWGQRIVLDAGVSLTPGEAHHVDERVEAARAWLSERIHDDRIEACSEVVA